MRTLNSKKQSSTSTSLSEEKAESRRERRTLSKDLPKPKGVWMSSETKNWLSSMALV